MNLFYHDEAIPRVGNSKEELCHAMWTSLLTSQTDEEACLVLLTNQATYFITSGGEADKYTTQNLKHDTLKKVVIGVGNQSVRLSTGNPDSKVFTCLTRDSSLGHIFVTRITFIVDTDFAKPSHELPAPEASGSDSEDEPSIYDSPGKIKRANSTCEHPSGVTFMFYEKQYLQDLAEYIQISCSSGLNDDLTASDVMYAHQIVDDKLSPVTLTVTNKYIYVIQEDYSSSSNNESSKHFSFIQAIDRSDVSLDESGRPKLQIYLTVAESDSLVIQFSSSDSLENFSRNWMV